MNRNFDLDWSAAVDAMPLLLEGARLTLVISVVGLFFGFLIGLAAGLARTSGNRILSGISAVYVELIRGTPILVQAIWIYFALPIALGMEIERLTAAIAAIAVNSGVYIAEIVRFHPIGSEGSGGGGAFPRVDPGADILACRLAPGLQADDPPVG